ncbi:MAG: deoxyribose-phosphate aldolase [Clostridiales Family XIII bacterium]|nr:deoxyribose-phosphate aldolase [Clostridiales Family XIII bacterium]
MGISVREFANVVDFTAVSASVCEADVHELIKYAKQYQFIAIGVPPCFVKLAKDLLGASDIIIGGSSGFPSGNDKTFVKVMMARDMLAAGCKEIDMVINIAYMKSGLYDKARDDIKAVVDAIDGTLLKVILEVPYMTDDEIKHGCEIIAEAGADFVKTGTGWAPNPTKIEQVKLIKSVVGDSLKIKVAGGVRTLSQVEELLSIGVERFGIGKSSALKIIEEIEARG